jgi:glycosyltransferase involved in cell wall biosynthesis
LSIFQRSPTLLRLRQRIPVETRQSLSALFWPTPLLQNASRNLDWLTEKLKIPSRYDVILVCPDFNVPGVLALAAELHPRLVVVSLAGLAGELKSKSWSWIRDVVKWRLKGKAHPFLFQPIFVSKIQRAIFASQYWQAQALRAGLPEPVTRVIYFGVPVHPALPRSLQVHQRLLWVGRLAPEKGLHVLLAALPRLLDQFPKLTLTAIAGQGETEYRQSILDLITRLNLSKVVNLHPPVERMALRQIYAEHDALFFYSVFAEPVALVLMEAYLTGIPVVANRSTHNSDLIQDKRTCLCYQPGDEASLATAIATLLTDDTLRTQLSYTAQRLVHDKYSLAAMGEAYDNLLRQFSNL